MNDNTLAQAVGSATAAAIEAVSNQGRWGADDELGTLNHITDEVRARAVSEARLGRFVSLGARLDASAVIPGPMAAASPPFGPVVATKFYTGSPPMSMAEQLTVNTHHPQLTHLDALTHTVVDNKVYPGVPLPERATFFGITKGSSAAFSGGIVSRGVFLDLAPGGRLPERFPITGAVLDDACARTGVEVLPGDAVVVRSGWRELEPGRATAGFTPDGVRWLGEKSVSVYAGDIGDSHPILDPENPTPLHRIGLVHLGLVLCDAADPTALAEVCAELGRYTFMIVFAPMRVDGLTGLPVNPLAIF
ncbi:cyclase family protein [Amycolatopsis sp. H20-H5]|uniref:cyclase family protein n=1 Tax=Amycolatopsis sp. H20-H5 TaxID=3046309 RepID=UPI002DBE5339|nr:cyclase family protein [Amycolatopsis sp. H20-H5]MEC3975749.1 cyclase family protein [Amycolatopsis sp. H20-H5]